MLLNISLTRWDDEMSSESESCSKVTQLSGGPFPLSPLFFLFLCCWPLMCVYGIIFPLSLWPVITTNSNTPNPNTHTHTLLGQQNWAAAEERSRPWTSPLNFHGRGKNRRGRGRTAKKRGKKFVCYVLVCSITPYWQTAKKSEGKIMEGRMANLISTKCACLPACLPAF